MDLLHSSRFSSRIKDLMERRRVPGLSIAITHNGATASLGYGKASIDPPQECTADTLFDIASASKSLTAASVALLIYDDVNYPDVKWESTISKLLPDDFVMPIDEYTKAVTIEDILSHRSGMASHDYSYLSPRAKHPDNARSVTKNLRNLPVVAPIRSKYIYCNMMYTVATHVIETKTGMFFSDFLEKFFFAPLGMASTSLQPERARAKGFGNRIALGHIWDEERGLYHEFQTPDCPDSQGAGSIITSVNDYIKWVSAMMHHKTPITDDIFDGIIESRIIIDPKYKDPDPLTSPATYAAGWAVYFYRGHMIVEHDGLVSGFGSRHFFLPDFKFGGVIFGNSTAAGTVAAIISRDLIDEVLGVPNDDRPNWENVEDERQRENGEENETSLREKLCPDIKEPQPQVMPLDAYIGEYWSPGYHSISVQIKDGKLFIDATDRSMGFSLTFDHVCDQTKFIAHLSDFLEGGDILMRAEFRFQDGIATEIGLHLESDLDEYIWFSRLNKQE